MPTALPPQQGKEPAVEAKGPIIAGAKIKTRPKSEKWLSATGVRYDLGGYQLYFIQVAMGDSSFSVISLFAHPEQFDKAQLDEMCADAAKVVLETRIAPRRKGIALAQDPVPDPKKLNEESFQSDKDLFDGVLIDKYGFEQVVATATRIAVETTVKGVNHNGT